ncbi:MAG: hypothetical protein SGI86_01130 [Deltaproteobacteria bacterium]|nr:hypothetical protein [Deltaproteobacteria bacterium]
MNPNDLNHNDDADISRRLRALRAHVEDLPGRDFRMGLHRTLVAAGPPEPQGWFERARQWFAEHPALGWPAVGVATGAATFAFLMAMQHPPAEMATTGTTTTTVAMPKIAEIAPAPALAHSVPSSRTAVIHLNFTAEVRVEDVTFEVDLPEGLSFSSKGEAMAERRFRWPGTLEAGENVLPVAVRGEKPGLYRVKARAEIADQVIEQEILLQVEGAS